jgi:ribosomal-protein-alanine N-acetyltransferase
LPPSAPTSGQDRFRTPEEKDLPQLYRLDHESFGEIEGYPFFFLRQLFDAHRRDFLLLERSGVLCGYALPVLGAQEDTGLLLALAVLPAFQGQGCGRALLHAAVLHVRSAGARQMNLVVRPDNHAARHLYTSYGFTGDELQPGYYGEGRDRIFMSLALSAPSED